MHHQCWLHLPTDVLCRNPINRKAHKFPAAVSSESGFHTASTGALIQTGVVYHCRCQGTMLPCMTITQHRLNRFHRSSGCAAAISTLWTPQHRTVNCHCVNWHEVYGRRSSSMLSPDAPVGYLPSMFPVYQAVARHSASRFTPACDHTVPLPFRPHGGHIHVSLQLQGRYRWRSDRYHVGVAFDWIQWPCNKT